MPDAKLLMSELALKLYLRRFQIDSTRLFSLMNHNKLNYELIVENDLTSCKAAQMDKPDLKLLPAISIRRGKDFITHEGYNEAFGFLSKNSYLKKGVAHSAYEEQSIQFIETEVLPLAQAMTYGLRPKFEMAFRNSISMSKSTNIFVITRIFNIFTDTLRLYTADFSKPRIKEVKFKLGEQITEWKIRLGSNDFHGGSTPDLADFYMFSVLSSPEFIMKPVVKKNWRVEWMEKMKAQTEQAQVA